MSMAMNLRRMGICDEEFPSMKSPDPLSLQCHVNYFSGCIATTTKPMGTKLCKVVTYYKTFWPIDLCNDLWVYLFSMWSREVTRKLKNVSSLVRCISINVISITSYLYYPNTHSYQTWKCGHIQREASYYKVLSFSTCDLVNDFDLSYTMCWFRT